MKPAFVVSFMAAAVLHALLLFGFRFGTPARPLPATDDTAPVDVNLVAAAPEVPAVAPPPVSTPPPEITPPAPEPMPKPVATPPPQPPKPRTAVRQPAKNAAPHAPVAPANASATGPAATSHARYRSNPKPAYPIEARNLRQEGIVMLSVQVGADGRVVNVSLKRSSGYSSLDQAAIRGVQGWSFEPARTAGIAVASRVDVPVRFSLSGR